MWKRKYLHPKALFINFMQFCDPCLGHKNGIPISIHTLKWHKIYVSNIFYLFPALSLDSKASKMSKNCSLDLKIGSTQMNHNIIDSTGPSVILRGIYFHLFSGFLHNWQITERSRNFKIQPPSSSRHLIKPITIYRSMTKNTRLCTCTTNKIQYRLLSPSIFQSFLVCFFLYYLEPIYNNAVKKSILMLYSLGKVVLPGTLFMRSCTCITDEQVSQLALCHSKGYRKA